MVRQASTPFTVDATKTTSYLLLISRVEIALSISSGLEWPVFLRKVSGLWLVGLSWRTQSVVVIVQNARIFWLGSIVNQEVGNQKLMSQIVDYFRVMNVGTSVLNTMLSSSCVRIVGSIE